MTVFLEGREPLRSAAAFDARIASAARRHRPARAGNLAQRAGLRSSGSARIQSALPKAPAPAAADIRAQLAWLVPAGFLLTYALGAAPGVSALSPGHRAAAREARPRTRAATRSCGRDRAARGALPRAGQGGARPASRRAKTNSAGCSRSSACRCSRSSSRRAYRCPRGGSHDAWAERMQSSLI